MTTKNAEKQVGKRTDASLLEVDDVYTRFSAGTVKKITFNKVIIKNSQGSEWEIDKPIVESEMAIASQIQGDPEKLNRTDMIGLIQSNPRIAMTIVYHKKLDGQNVADALEDGKGDKTPRQWIIQVNKALKGEERTLQGYHENTYDSHGHLLFSCLGDTIGIRKVNLRTVKSVIVNHTQYLLK